LPRWNKFNVLVLALALVALAGGGVFYAALAGYFSASRASLDANIPKRPVAVAALGRIEPRSEIINLGAGVAPDRLDALFVARGDVVKKGQVLGRLGAYNEQAAQLDMFSAQIDEARERLKTETALDQSRIQAAEVHQRMIEEVSPQRIAAQQAAIESIDAKLANDKDILSAQAVLFSQGSASRRVNDDQRTTVAQDEANLASARAHLTELQHQFEIDRIDAKVQIDLTHAQLERAQAEVPIASLERQIAMAQARAQRLSLIAPIDGRILNILVLPGEEVGSGPVLTMGDTSGMRAVAEVYETDIAQVHIGQTATVSARALPQPVRGKVVRIGDMVFKNDVLNVDPAARADARVVEVWIDLDDPELMERLTNMTVDVLIDVDDNNVPLASSDRP